MRKLLAEVREELANQYQLLNNKTDDDTNCAAPEQRAIGTSH
jgi:hypothetical protein